MASISRQMPGFAEEPIARVDPSDARAIRQALAVLLTGRTKHASAAVDQFLQFTSQQKVAMDRLWTVGTAEEPRAAVMVAPNLGRTAMLFVSPATRSWQREPVVRLVRAAIEAEDAQQVTMVQALLDPAQDDEAAALLAAGFERLATLMYMQARPQVQPGEMLAAGGCEVVHWSEASRPLFERAILASYERTLDCPGLLGRRPIEDIIAGHMATGSFDPQLWTVCTIDDEPAAVMLLSELPDTVSRGTMELVYLGVSEPHRGQGLARRLVRHAMVTAAARGLHLIVLAVDEANTPAMALYRSFQFRPSTRKLALIAGVT